ncbi:hypothetical protein ACLI1A_10170 [Flavobacterium sp. RHBU_3]|uniref:hypothetical protein n=1 Tax=Flavobacterium sp. RHBU_3 TaxID=3391184 RepID=UPI003984D8AE
MKKLNKKATDVNLDSINLEMLKLCIAKGPESLPDEYNRYLSLLDKIRGMHISVDKFGNPELIINHLVKYEGLSVLKAREMYNEALEYFYANVHLSKEAYRNMYADKADRIINTAMVMAKDVSDLAKVMKMIHENFLMRGLDVPDPDEKPEIYNPFKVYTTKPEDLGMELPNRNRVKGLIDGQIPGLTEKAKSMLYRELGVDQFKAFLDEQEDGRKDRR